ncbi:hypothetical protein PJ900_06405 [Tistrella mobilis]|uniref:hypothetical protein n=1 Tax=Tistrella mobilis TaxID=171437 RepID=UPI0012E88256|nr:hypothetical protein [Tistrella mobilis]
MSTSIDQIGMQGEATADVTRDAVKGVWSAPQLQCVELDVVTRAQAGVTGDGITVS